MTPSDKMVKLGEGKADESHCHDGLGYIPSKYGPIYLDGKFIGKRVEIYVKEVEGGKK